MTASSLTPIRLRLAQLAAHLVVALVALVVIGGATRVMEAGLACPDWPLCCGTLLPGRQMNLQVFLNGFTDSMPSWWGLPDGAARCRVVVPPDLPGWLLPSALPWC